LDNTICTVSHWELWRSTSVIHLFGIAQIEKGINSLTRADPTKGYLTLLTYLLTYFLYGILNFLFRLTLKVRRASI